MARNTCHDARFAPHVGADVNARQCTGVEKDLSKMPREPVEKHLSWSSDIPPAARFPPLDLQETHFASGSGLLMHPQDSDLDAPGPFRLNDNVFYLF